MTYNKRGVHSLGATLFALSISCSECPFAPLLDGPHGKRIPDTTLARNADQIARTGRVTHFNQKGGENDDLQQTRNHCSG